MLLCSLRLLVSDSEQASIHLSVLFSHKGTKIFFSVSCFCKVEISVLLIELKRLCKLT